MSRPSQPIALIARVLSVCVSHASKAGGGETGTKSKSKEVPFNDECCSLNYSITPELKLPTHIDSNIFDDIHKEREQKYQHN